MPPAPARLDVFISYAAADEIHKNVLRKHLSLLKREGKIRTWHAGRVDAGDGRAAKLSAQLDAAQIILLLISADYLAMDTQWREMERALARHAAGLARVIPVLLDACDWESAPFAHLGVLPSGHKPVRAWANPSEAWASVVRGLRASIEKQRTVYMSPANVVMLPWVPCERTVLMAAGEFVRSSQPERLAAPGPRRSRSGRRGAPAAPGASALAASDPRGADSPARPDPTPPDRARERRGAWCRAPVLWFVMSALVLAAIQLFLRSWFAKVQLFYGVVSSHAALYFPAAGATVVVALVRRLRGWRLLDVSVLAAGLVLMFTSLWWVFVVVYLYLVHRVS